MGDNRVRLNPRVAPRHYSYRVDHDLGFAPHVERNVATVCGCKITTIERWAEVGSWIIGTGGNRTGRPNRLVYAMEVTDTPTVAEFRALHPKNARYLSGRPIDDDARVLVSRGKYFYFGASALPIPRALAHIIHPTQGCRRVSDSDIALLHREVLSRFHPGKHGTPSG